MSNKYPGGIITSGANAGYSVAFDGTGDYLSEAYNAWMNFGTADFTVECWVYPTSLASASAPFNFSATSTSVNSDVGWTIYVGANNSGNEAGFYSGSTKYAVTGWSLTANQWQHIALVRGSGSLKFYINGTQVGSTVSANVSVNSNAAWEFRIGNYSNNSTRYWNGYISNFRAVPGTAVYTSTFTPPTQLLAVTNTSLLTCNSPAIVDQSSNAFAITANGNAAVSTFTPFTGYTAYNPALGASTPGIWTVSEALDAAQTRRWNMYDPYFNLTTLLLHGNGTNGAQNNTFLDSSSNNFTITRNGNTTQGTFSPFSQTGWSNYFSGTTDYLAFPSIAAYGVGTGNFTVEASTVFNSSSGNQRIFCIGVSGTDGLVLQYISGTGVMVNIANATVISYAWTPTIGAWYNFAVVRSGTGANQVTLYINGVSVATGTSAGSIGQNQALVGGLSWTSTYTVNGYVSNVRYSNTARTISASPTANLTSDANTLLLTCQSNRFVDTSSNANSVSIGGTPSVQAFSPFLTNIAYTPTNQGGSGYFDGTGDYLTTPSSANLAMGSGDVTAECWFYPFTSGNQQWLFDFRTSGSESTTTLYAYISETNSIMYTGFGGFGDQASGTPIKNAWNHMAIVRSGSGSNNVAVFLNGVRTLQLTDTTNLSTSTSVYVGRRYSATAGQHMAGYIAATRMVKGTAVYSPSASTLTVPTAPPTPITNTQLLLNFTNAGIVDSTAKNVLETVGNAQISTTQSKFGGSSLLFNGSSDYLVSTAANTRNLVNFGTGDFTVECWVYFNGTGTNQGFLDSATSTSSGTSGQWFFNITSAGNLQYGQHGVGAIISAAWSVSTGVWYHIAICRSSGQSRLFANGVQLGSTTSDTVNYNNAGSLQVGVNATPYWMNGYIDEIRISRYARYTANFTPQTSQWQDQ